MANNQATELEQQKEKLEKEIKELETKIGEQDGRLNHLQSSGFQLANFYFVFQGVILTAIANGASALRCSNRWFLFSISLSTATLNLFALLVIGLKYNRSFTERDRSWFQCHALQNKLCALNDLVSTQTHSAQVSQSSIQTQAQWKISDDSYAKFVRTFCLVFCMLLFVFVAIVMIVACWTIRRPECNHSSSTVNDKCFFRLCDGAKCIRICDEY